MIASKDMLSKMMEPSGSNDSSKEVIQMCLNNLSMSKKVAKLLIKGINQYQVEKVTKYLRLLKKFLRLDDEHKMARIEWTLGVPQLHHKK
jgi:ribosomal protein L17